MILRAVPALDGTLSFPDTSCPTGLPENDKAGSQCLPNALLVPSTAGTLGMLGRSIPALAGSGLLCCLWFPTLRSVTET